MLEWAEGLAVVAVRQLPDAAAIGAELGLHLASLQPGHIAQRIEAEALQAALRVDRDRQQVYRAAGQEGLAVLGLGRRGCRRDGLCELPPRP
jgi:hypothetical protein